MNMLGMSPSPDKRRRSNIKTKGSFIAPSGSFIGGSFVEGAALAPETEE
jgi:hypothetical protein